jgi:hypothetical protein
MPDDLERMTKECTVRSMSVPPAVARRVLKVADPQGLRQAVLTRTSNRNRLYSSRLMSQNSLIVPSGTPC